MEKTAKCSRFQGRGIAGLAAVALAAGSLLGGCGGGGGAPTGTETETTGTGTGGSTGSTSTGTRTAGAPGSGSTVSAPSAGSSPTAPTGGATPTTAPDAPVAPNGAAPAAPTGAAAPAPGTATTPAAPAGATAATSAPAAAGAASKGGTIIPLYSVPATGTWAAVEAAKRAHPTVPVLAVINPANGPGTAALSDYLTGIASLTSAGVKMIGYVHTSYGARPIADIEADVDRWKSLFPSVSGIFFDEMANTPGHESFYAGLTAYAKSHGFDFTIGNPGADAGASYVGTVDVILIYENQGLPAVSTLGGWHTSYDRHNFGVIPYGVPSLDAAFVTAATATCGYVYMENDGLPNPWDTVPPYLSDLLGALS